MFKEAIYHRPKNEFAYAADQRTLHIKLKTKKNDVDRVRLIHGDPYDYNPQEDCWISQTKSMSFNGNDDLYDYWFVEIQPPNHRLRYGFELEAPEETLYFTEKGFYQSKPRDAIFYFCFPYLNAIDVFSPPDWVNSTVWYQIFPERFANGDSSINPKGTIPWGSTEPAQNNFFGGDFQGVINHLDYLEELGITGIYFTPIFLAYSNHKYDTIDYMEIDPQFGDKETFKELVNQCHKRGIRVMLDAVFNHSGFYFGPFQDVIKNEEESQYKDWFHLHGFPLKTTGQPNYDAFGYVPSMPKLNTENEEVKAYLLKVALYWIEEFDIDGWRLDVANEVDHSFWREFRKTVKQAKPDAYILGEIWHDSMPWLQGDQFDAVMNYPLTAAINDFFAYNSIGQLEFEQLVTKITNMYPETINDVQFNLLGSHDTSRILTVSQNNKEKVKLQMLVQFTMAGTPCIYYGDEIAMTGGKEPESRKCMIWDKENQDLDMFAFVQKLILLRKQFKLFRTNKNFSFPEASKDENTLSYRKSDHDSDILIVINNHDQVKEATLPIDYQNKIINDLWNAEEKKTTLKIELKPYSFHIFQLPKD